MLPIRLHGWNRAEPPRRDSDPRELYDWTRRRRLHPPPQGRKPRLSAASTPQKANKGCQQREAQQRPNSPDPAPPISPQEASLRSSAAIGDRHRISRAAAVGGGEKGNYGQNLSFSASRRITFGALQTPIWDLSRRYPSNGLSPTEPRLVEHDSQLLDLLITNHRSLNSLNMLRKLRTPITDDKRF